MSDSLAVRIGYRMKFVEDPVERVLLNEARDELNRLAGLDGADGGISARAVLEWMGKNGFSLVTWQRRVFVRDHGLSEEEVETLCPRPGR